MKDFDIVNISEDEIDWLEAYPHYFKYTVSVKLRNFEYKFRMRLLYGNSRLIKMGIINYTNCNVCGFEVEDLKHIFWEWPRVKALWYEVISRLNQTFALQLEVNPQACLFNPFATENVYFNSIINTKYAPMPPSPHTKPFSHFPISFHS